MEFNLATVFDRVAAAVPDREAIVWRDRRLTYADVVERTNRLASYLHDQGLGVRSERAGLAGHESGQDHLALYLLNGNEYLEGMIAGYKARVAPFNVNYRYVAEELRYLLNDADARAIIYGASFADTLAEVLPDLPELSVLIQVDDGVSRELLPGAISFEDALAAGSPDGPPVTPSPDDLYILYTGGTTGMPKGVLWRQADIYIAAMGGRPIGSTGDPFDSYEAIAEAAVASGGGLRMLPTPPFMHGASQWAAFITFTSGGTLVVQDDVRSLSASDVLSVVEREKVVSLLTVGDAIARPIIEEMEAGNHDLSSLFAVSNGGAALNATLKERLLAVLPNSIVLDAVGSSETGAQMTHASTAAAGASTGTFTPGPDTIVVDADMAHILAPGDDEMGWLAQRGRVPLGYLGDEGKTSRTFPVIDGVRVAVPGDRARIDADGVIELLGRDSVTINSGGEKIFAEEVEQAIAAHPAVYDVVVVGRPSERWGSEVVAIVQVHDDMTVTEEELLEECGRHIARYKFPKAFLFRPAIQRSPAGKADYRWAKALAGDAPAS